MSILDTRDLEAEREELATELEALTDAAADAREALDELEGNENVEQHADKIGELRETLLDAMEALQEWRDSEEYETLTELNELRDQIEEWDNGTTLIPDYEFQDYAREFAEDIGAIERNAGWPADYIDWELAANALRSDYTTVEYDGNDYYYR